MEDFIITYIALAAFTGALFLHSHDGNPGDVSINLLNPTLETIKNEKATKFGVMIIFIGWIIWNLIVLPWTIMGVGIL